MSEQERRDFFAGERIAQRYADQFYRARGHRVLSRDGCKGWDCIVDIGGKPTHVEEKFRTIDRPDLLVEVMQDIATGAPGWLYETRCDVLHYFVVDGHRKPFVLYQLTDWPAFKQWFSEYVRNTRNLTWIKSNKGWGITVNIAVPFGAIPLELMRKYDVEAVAA